MKFSTAFSLLALLVASKSADETCYLPIDVVFLQDTTGSFVEDLPNVVNQIPSMVAEILAQNPESYFAVAEFKDKPFYPLGESDDFCYKLQGPLQGKVDTFEADYAKLYASGGGDLPEAQFQALIDVSMDPNVKWRPIVTGSRNTAETGAHLVIMSTDAVPHLPGDMQKWSMYPTVPQNLPANPGSINPPSLSEACSAYDYPSDTQMKEALRKANIFLAILTPNDPLIVPTWQWVNQDLLDQPADFYQFIRADSSDLIDGVLKAVKAVTEYACTTTTPVPITTASTTTTTTTTPTTTTATTTPTTTTTTTTPTTTTTTTTPTTTTTTTTPTTTTTTTTSTTTTTTTTPTTTTTTTTPTTPTTTTTTTTPTTPTTTTTTTTPTTTTTTTTPTTTTTTTAPTTTTTTTTLTSTATTTTPTTTTTTTSIPSTTTTTTTSTSPTEATTSTTQPTPITTLPSASTAEVDTDASAECPPCEVCPPCTPEEECPPCEHRCCHTAAVVVKVNHRPHKLVIEYEK